MFLRLSANDGATESWAFTEIDRSAAVGAIQDGALWHRDRDEFGAAFVLNGLSAPHRAYLPAAGFGFILGDGALNYAPEILFRHLLQNLARRQRSRSARFISRSSTLVGATATAVPCTFHGQGARRVLIEIVRRRRIPRPGNPCLAKIRLSALRIEANGSDEAGISPHRSHSARYALRVGKPVACCVVLLQLATALHSRWFRTVLAPGPAASCTFTPPRRASGRSGVEPAASQQSSLVSDAASCAPDSCPIGFAGPHSFLLAAPQTSGLLGRGAVAESAPQPRLAVPRARALLNAPKTSPPSRV